jgi:hypothetical protein
MIYVITKENITVGKEGIMNAGYIKQDAILKHG